MEIFFGHQILIQIKKIIICSFRRFTKQRNVIFVPFHYKIFKRNDTFILIHSALLYFRSTSFYSLASIQTWAIIIL